MRSKNDSICTGIERCRGPSTRIVDFSVDFVPECGTKPRKMGEVEKNDKVIWPDHVNRLFVVIPFLVFALFSKTPSLRSADASAFSPTYLCSSSGVELR